MWLIIIFLCALSLVAMFLWIPVWIRSAWDGKVRTTELRYLGLRFQIKGVRRRKKRRKKRRRARALIRPEVLLGVWDEFTLADFQALPRFVQDLLVHLNLRVRRLHVRVATPDPALTGILGGWVLAVAQLLPENWPVRVESSFTEKSPQTYYEVEVRTRPAEPLWDVIHLIAHLPVWRLARFWRRMRK